MFLMIEKSLISLFIVVSALLFVNRIYSKIKKQHIFIRKLMTKIGTFHFIFLFLIYFFYFSKPFQIWFSIFLSLIILPLIIFLLTKIHQRQFHSEFLRFLSLLIIKMQMGSAFRTAFEKCLVEETWKQASFFGHIYENVVFSQQKVLPKAGGFGSFIAEILQEFAYAQTYSHQSIDRLCNFRDQLLDDQFFRRRSSEIWMHFALQLVVLSIIYWGIFVYVCWNYGFQKYFSIFSVSLSFYFLGVFILQYLIRRKVWHI